MKSISKMTKWLFTTLLGLTVVAFPSQALAQGNTWESRAPMPTARTHLMAGVINGKLYVVGGSPSGEKLEVYDPTTNLWSSGLDAPTFRSGSAGGVIDGKLYSAGGCISH